jgi:hypothetical protein
MSAAPKPGTLAPRQRVDVERVELPIPEPFERGQWVRIEGRHGLWKVYAGNADGSLTLYREQFRSVTLDKVRAATKAEIRKAGKA